MLANTDSPVGDQAMMEPSSGSANGAARIERNAVQNATEMTISVPFRTLSRIFQLFDNIAFCYTPLYIALRCLYRSNTATFIFIAVFSDL